ncbi:hypothetical protein IJG93_02655 [Candidatus Saccharibacteria bacterium]|nr:hypothetical protein [Candidatus Saccharibacteria bacterium]
MEKDPNKSTNSGEAKSKWDDMANFEKQLKAFREAREAKAAEAIKATEPAKEIEPANAGMLTPEEINALLNGLPENQTEKTATEPTDTSEKSSETEKEQAREIEKSQAMDAELAESKEEEIQQNSKELYDLVQEEIELERLKDQETKENVEDYKNTIQELLELENVKNIEDYRDVNEELLELEEQIAREERNNRPLVAINADWTHDKKEMAHDLAEQTLNAEVANGNIISKLWKGTLFKKYYEKKYEKEFLSEKRTNKDGKTLTDLIREESPAVMERFVLSAVEDESRYVHEASGEKLVSLDEKTNKKLKSAIKEYARTSLRKGEKVSDLDREFENEIDRILEDAGEIPGNTNYLEVAKEATARYKEIAINAKSKAEHEKALAEVMAGFQAYHADVRNNVRTEAHRDALDKIVNWCESNPVGQFIPAEIVAGAAGAAVALTQTGVRAVFGAVGGIVASSAIAGLKERNRITEDRARMMRDIASGKDYNSKNKKVAKYETRIGDTLYDIRQASDLTDRLEAAMYPENGKVDRKALLSAIAEARVRIDFSDAESKDLIAYSSDQDRGKERLDLDIAVIRAEKSLSQKDQKLLEIMKEHIREDIDQSVSEQDRKFKNYRTIAAVKKAGKSLALGSAIFLGSQEIMAAIDPAKIGIFEKAGLIKTENANDAKETLLASGFGQFKGSYEVAGAPKKLEVNGVSKADAIKKYEADGFTKIKTKDAWTETKSTLTEVDPSASTAKVDVKYDGWASNGNLGTGIENGKFISTIKGAATINGKSVNYTPDQVKAFITVGDSKFEIIPNPDEAGQLSWGDNGVFTTTTGETIKAIGDNGEKLYKYFEVAVDNGVENGVQHITPLATDVGANTFSGKIEQLVDTVVEHPAVYSFVKEIPGESETFVRGVTANGFAFAPELARTGLGETIAPEAPEAPTSEAPAEAVPEQPSLREVLESVPEENIEVMPNAPVEVDITPEAESAPNEPTLVSPVDLSSTLETPPDEPAESVSEAESTPESDFRNWENDMLEDIESVRDAIGDEGVAAFTDSTPLNKEQQARWSNWWSTLDENAKNAIKELDNHITNSNPTYAYSFDRKFGVPFQTWLAQNS